MERYADECDVCIVGGGPAGMSTAIKLKHQDSPKRGAAVRGRRENRLRSSSLERGRFPGYPSTHLPWWLPCWLQSRFHERAQDQGNPHCHEERDGGGGGGVGHHQVGGECHRGGQPHLV